MERRAGNPKAVASRFGAEVKYILRFNITGLPKLPNGGHGNWRADHAQKMKWRKLVGQHLWGQVPKKPLKKAKALFIRHSSVRPDDDNLIMGFKAIRDSLKFYGIIEDDKSSVLTSQYMWQEAKPREGYISVYVEEEENEDKN